MNLQHNNLRFSKGSRCIREPLENRPRLVATPAEARDAELPVEVCVPQQRPDRFSRIDPAAYDRSVGSMMRGYYPRGLTLGQEPPQPPEPPERGPGEPRGPEPGHWPRAVRSRRASP